MKLHQSFGIVAIGLCLSLSGIGEVNAKPNNFIFTKIADTNGEFSSFFSGASINNKGTVAFGANLDAGGQGIYASNGRITKTIADTNSSSGSFSRFTYSTSDSNRFSFFPDPVFAVTPSINDRDTVAFVSVDSSNSAVPTPGTIFTGNGNSAPVPVSLVPDTLFPGPFAAGYPSINNAGTVVYLGINFRNFGILTSDGRLIDFESDGRAGTVDSPTINDAGTIAYRRQLLGSRFQILSNNATQNSNIIYENIFPFFVGTQQFGFNSPSINNAGTVSFVTVPEADQVEGFPAGTLNPKKAVVLKSNGTNTIAVADTSGDFSSFGIMGFPDGNTAIYNLTSINDRGNVAFLADLDTGGEAIFIENNSVLERTIATGDSLFGYTVVDLTLSREGLNDRGQVAFIAKLANNTEVVVRANPKRQLR